MRSQRIAQNENENENGKRREGEAMRGMETEGECELQVKGTSVKEVHEREREYLAVPTNFSRLGSSSGSNS